MTGTSTPISPTQLRAALTKFECKVRYIDGWETRNRGDRGDGWGPVIGFMVHHTGDDAPDDADRRIIINGRTDLPGPLAQFGLNDDGVVDVIGWGRANHAGPGDPDVYAAVRDESYGSYPPKPDQKLRDGNAAFWGVETYYSGSHKPVQYNAMVNLAAAIVDAQGWTGKSVIGHREWNYDKPDPGNIDMAVFRQDVDARIKAVNGGQTSTSGDLSMADITTLINKLEEIDKRNSARYSDIRGLITTLTSQEAGRYSDTYGRISQVLAAAEVDDADVEKFVKGVMDSMPDGQGVSQAQLTEAMKTAIRDMLTSVGQEAPPPTA